MEPMNYEEQRIYDAIPPGMAVSAYSIFIDRLGERTGRYTEQVAFLDRMVEKGILVKKNGEYARKRRTKNDPPLERKQYIKGKLTEHGFEPVEDEA